MPPIRPRIFSPSTVVSELLPKQNKELLFFKTSLNLTCIRLDSLFHFIQVETYYSARRAILICPHLFILFFHRPSKSKIGTLDFTSRMTVFPEYKSFDIMFFKIFPDTFEGAFYLDHILAMPYENIFVKVISVAVKMKTEAS